MGNMASRDPKTQSSSVSDEEYEERVSAFISGGGCKETYGAYGLCLEKAGSMKEGAHKCMPMLLSSMEVHSDYYQPYLAARKAAQERADKEMGVIYDTKLGGSSEGFYRFLEGGACKESAVAWKDCREKEGFAKCKDELYTMWRCMEAHFDYYERPFHGVEKLREDLVRKEMEAVLFKAE